MGKNSGVSGNKLTHLGNPYLKGFSSNHSAIDSRMTAKNIEDAMSNTAEHLLVYADSSANVSL